MGLALFVVFWVGFGGVREYNRLPEAEQTAIKARLEAAHHPITPADIHEYLEGGSN